MDSLSKICTTCGKQFVSEVKLKKHMREVHELSPQSCKECGKRYFGRQQLTNHMKSHQAFSCSICLKVIPKNSQSAHKYQCKGVSFDCNWCEFKTFRTDVLSLHEKKHNKERLELSNNTAFKVSTS